MKAIVLLSGGLDSLVVLSYAIDIKRDCVALSFDYGQRNLIELESAKKIAHYYEIPHKIVRIDTSFFAECSTSSLLCHTLSVTSYNEGQGHFETTIPNTYVPARNTLFLAYATAYAEIIEAQEIYYGANLADQSGYVDCRPTFFAAFQKVLDCSTKQAIEGRPPRLVTPISTLTKEQIIQKGARLGAPLELSWSCYAPTDQMMPCKICKACLLREEGFLKNKISF